jgi:hypothetical protein
MPNQIDLDYRPHSYFWAKEIGVQLSSQIKGAQRKALYDASVAEAEVSDLDEFLQKPSLSPQERDLIGKLHPSFMGGEYLPDKGSDEVEIARITINSTTQDVTSVYASLRENQIHYRVVDEYEGGTLSEESESLTKTPMTLSELTDFFLSAWPLLEVLEMNFGETDTDPDDIRYFVLDASSSFYAQFGELIYLRVDEWLAEKGFLKNKENIEDSSDEIESIEDQHIKEWLERSDWPRSALRDALGLGARAENSQRKKAVFQYAKRYFDKNKALPTGAHNIDEVVPKLGGDFSGLQNKFNFSVIFPEK